MSRYDFEGYRPKMILLLLD